MKVPWEFEEPACAEVGGDFWFPDKSDSSREMYLAKSICASCTHKVDCLEWALQYERFGIWGGTTDSQRASIRRMRKNKSAKSN